jgi:hypothetical protein
MGERTTSYFDRTGARKIHLVLDNLSTHTPKHGSWLNAAEMEASLGRQQAPVQAPGVPRVLSKEWQMR